MCLRSVLRASLFFCLLISFEAHCACLDVPRTKFATDLGKAHASGTLARLDEKYAELGPFQVFIEHSLSEEDNGATMFVADVPSFTALASLLDSRRSEGRPWPKSRPLRKCANGVCSYDFLNGIEHGQLYLKELRYNDYVSCLQVETIWMLDGD